jgi:predicted AAA+ superfamily ATPase
MLLPTVLDTCEPRGDGLHGSIADADFATDLAKVICGEVSDDCKFPSRFFANTYPTQGLRNLPRNVLARLRGDSSATACIFRFDTRYGGGKRHELMTLTPAANGKARAASCRRSACCSPSLTQAKL